MGRFKLKGRWKLPRVARKLQLGGLVRQAAQFIPGGSTALSIYDMAGDPKQLKRAHRAAAKGQHNKAAHHAAKAGRRPKASGGRAPLPDIFSTVKNAASGYMKGGLKGAFGGAAKGQFDFGGGHGGGGGHRRRINPGNTRALRRAMSRVQSFAKLAHKTISFVHRVKLKAKGRKR